MPKVSAAKLRARNFVFSLKNGKRLFDIVEKKVPTSDAAMIRIILVAQFIAHMASAAEAPTGPFSHKQHAQLKMKCISCHAAAEADDSAGFPEVSRCKTCHVGIAADRKIPEARVYKVRDFVVFSHARHAAAKAACATCHGEVGAQHQLTLFRPTTMAACVSCHKEHKAAVGCNTCHELGQ